MLLQLVLSAFREVGSPLLLLISYFQEPPNIIAVIATSIGREEVSKETLHEHLDRANFKVMVSWKVAGL